MIRHFSILRELGSRQGRLVAACAATLVAASCDSSATTSGSSSFGSGGDSSFLAGDSDVFHVTGPEGGPFPEGRREYWIQNTSKHKVLRWSVAATIPWLEFSEKGGLLGPGAQTEVLAQIDHDVAESLAPGDYPADIVFRDARKGGGELYLSFLLSVTENAGGSFLKVTPAEAYVATGDVGGPVFPPSKEYILENEGDGDLDWSIGTGSDWLVLGDVTTGTLMPNERVSVDVRIDPTQGNLGAGQHFGEVDFVNLSGGEGTTSRDVELTLTSSNGDGRVTDGLQAFYTFEDGTGAVVSDLSGVSPPLDLVIEDPSKVSWLPGALKFKSPTRAISTAAAERFSSAVKASGEISVEAWVQPSNLTQEGPARIVTISDGAYLRNLTLGQGLWGSQPSDTFNMRFRTTQTDLDGMPMLTTDAGAAKSGLQHVVYTRSSSGQTRIYVDGVQKVEGQLGGNCSNWDVGYLLALGNEIGTSRPWLGTMHLVALYDRGLSSNEVQQNYVAGVDGGDVGYLVVEPSSNWSVSGLEGSTFDQSKIYELGNPGTDSIDWAVNASKSWVKIVGDASGELVPGASSQTRLALDGQQVSAFAPGTYSAQVSFENLTNDLGSSTIDVYLVVKSEGGGDDEIPGPTNTGPSDPSILVPTSSIYVDTDGTVIENVDVNGSIVIHANNVTIRNFRVTGSGGGYGIDTDYTANYSGIVLEDGEVREFSVGLIGKGFTARRLNVHEMQGDGMKSFGNTVVENSWFHHLGKKDGSHADGNQTHKGGNQVYRFNHFDMPVPESPNGPGPPYKSNACMFFKISSGNSCDDVLLENNWFNGGNYTIYLKPGTGPPPTNVRVLNNRFMRDYRYGVLVNESPSTTILGNYWYDPATGQDEDYMEINDDYGG